MAFDYLRQQFEALALVASDRSAGMALISVLGVLAIIAALVLHVATVSEVGALESKVLSDRGALRYAAESAAARAFWLAMSERRNPARLDAAGRSGTVDLGMDQENWRTDGSSHTISYGRIDVRVTLRDAATGLDVSGADPAGKIRALQLFDQADTEEAEAFDEFLDILADYTDKNDFLHPLGKERPEYESEGEFALPRNGPLQYREEALWLTGLHRAVSVDHNSGSRPVDVSLLTVVPPRGMTFGRSSRRPSLFSSSPDTIRVMARLSPAEVRDVLEARQRHLASGEALADLIGPEVLARLASRFSLDPRQSSGIASIEAVAAVGGSRRRLRLVRDSRSAAVRIRRNRPWLINWERVLP